MEWEPINDPNIAVAWGVGIIKIVVGVVGTLVWVVAVLVGWPLVGVCGILYGVCYGLSKGAVKLGGKR